VQITFTPTKDALMQSGVDKLLAWPEIELPTSDLGSLSQVPMTSQQLQHLLFNCAAYFDHA